MGIRIVSGRWHFRFSFAGHEYTANTWLPATEENRVKALVREAQARQRLREGDELRLAVTPFDRAMGQFLMWAEGEHREHPNTYKRLRGSSTSLVKFFGGTPVHAIRPGQIEDFKTWRRTMLVKEVTIRHDLHALSSFLKYARKQNWTRSNPLKEVAIPSDAGAVRDNILSRELECAYFECCKRLGLLDLHDVGRLIIRQGLRPEEVLSSQKVNLDLEAGTLRIPKGKSRAARRTITLTAEVRAILEARLAGDSPWFFPGRKKGRHLTQLGNAHERVLEAMGYKSGQGFVPYDLRHTFASRAVQAGVDLSTVAAILGHGNLCTVLRYVHVSQDHQAAAMRKLDALEQAGPAPGDRS